MSLQAVAKHMASKGRGPDTTLVHMTAGEVAGLQALARAHGGNLTVNPDTGLPEAGILSAILPTVLGAGLTMMSGGALSPLMAGMIVGGGYGLASGNLGKGLKAGIGAWGGGNLGAGLSDMGASSIANAAVPSAGIDMGAGAASAGYGDTGLGLLGAAPSSGAGISAGYGDTGLGMFGGAPAPGAGFEGAAQAATMPPVSTAPITQMPPQMSPHEYADKFKAAKDSVGGWDALSAGAKQAFGSKEGFDQFLNNMGGGMKTAQYGLAALYPMLDEMQKPKLPTGSSSPSAKYGYDPRRNPDPQGSYSGAYTGERRWFDPTYTDMAAGGRVEDNPYYTMTGQSGDAFKYLMGQGASPTPVATPMPKPVAAPVAGTGGGGYTYDPATGQYTPVAPVAGAVTNNPWVWYGGDASDGISPPGAGPDGVGDIGAIGGDGWAGGGPVGLAALGAAQEQGRMLRGPGDGVSDSIPAVIGNNQPARLADGEFVIPARIVSEIGNGSSEAGARKLYAMMDRVQKARAKTTGRNKVAVNSRADRALPA